jgi:hypothetical protein
VVLGGTKGLINGLFLSFKTLFDVVRCFPMPERFALVRISDDFSVASADGFSLRWLEKIFASNS